jgi:Ca2+-binding RTX toxin-like protein
MATAIISSEALGLLNALFTSSEDIIGVSFDNLETFSGILSAEFGDPVVQAASPTLIEVSLPVTGGSTYDLTITGDGMGPLTDIDAFLAAIGDGTATGSIDGLALAQTGTELLSVSISGTVINIAADDQEITLEGSFPSELASFSGLLALTDLLDFDTLGQLTPDERAALVASLSEVSLTELSLTDGATEALTFTVAPNAVTLSLSSFAVALAGDMPSNLGDLATAIFSGLDEGADPLFALIGAVDISGLTVLAADGKVIASLDGGLSGLDQLDISIDGLAVTDGAPVLFDPTATGLALTATNESSILIGTVGDDTLTGGTGSDTVFAIAGDDLVDAGDGADFLSGHDGMDTLRGGAGDDTVSGGDGSDTINGGEGDDRLIGGETERDLRDVIFGLAGHDSISGGHGNDEVRGGEGNDTVEGGFGADTVIGNQGDDVLTGSAFSDLLFGNDGFDFINGGFGSDRVNGGADADRFFHVGVAGHGSDWIQDFSDAEGDRLVWGGGAATAAQFQVNIAATAGAGDAGTDEAFVIYRPTGQILWALVDGAGESGIELQVGGAVYDLLA